MKHYACAILSAEGRILLGLRAPHRRSYANRWDVIGGLVEADETVHAALARELREEIGVVPTECSELGTIIDRNPEARGEATYHIFLVTAWSGGEPGLRNFEHSVIEWFTPEQAASLPDLALPEYAALFRGIAGPAQ